MSQDSTIYNEMNGEWVDAPPLLIKKLRKYLITRELFLMYAAVHNQKVFESSTIYMDLLGQWDNAAEELLPYVNLFCILHKGWSLN